MVVAVAFGALGAGPAWADPTPRVADRPPVSHQGPSARPSGESPGDGASPEVADPDALSGDVDVAPFRAALSREYFAVAPTTLPRRTLQRIADLDGVAAVEVVDAARVTIDGEPTSVLGVDPSTFRNYAPAPSARSDEIWQGVAEGRIALSNDVGKQRDLDVGSTVTVAGGRGEVDKEVWTHATSGVAGIDGLVSRSAARELGFPRGNGVIISAPDADLWELRDRLQEVLGDDAGLQLLAEDPEPRPSDAEGDPVADSAIEEMIAAAESRLGLPYVWGAEGPDSFDCSGLVQWAFAEAGVAVPRVTHDQWWAGEHVDFADARRGDLIFWRTDPTAPDYISHVAIYLGDGMMLEAPRSGDVVKVTEVRTDRMAGVVRVRIAD
ncbi:hydrolase [Marinitenerispora sediminis]|uniref:Hydrolase n=2 Tax=Marinitenerispora sediminis TaxID=1931232 RepID=A0A368T6R9_9ACTN|nr:hydrolase [Marinitenerispora sediminis]RCV55605.1 hydrolase [Marinitenerispora sediminis]RCV59200.1 hydrolase [Marinitenerispora sediminis]